jgi:hypothetical protein
MGSLKHNVAGVYNVTLDLGVDQNGNASSLLCAYGYKVGWTPIGGNAQSQVFSY